MHDTGLQAVGLPLNLESAHRNEHWQPQHLGEYYRMVILNDMSTSGSAAAGQLDEQPWG